MFNIIKQEYLDKYGLILDHTAESGLLDLQRSVQSITGTSAIIGDTSVPDLLTSLVFSRSCDFTLTKKNVFARDYPREKTPIYNEDVDYAIQSTPCKCPANYNCCKEMATDNINYVIVFPEDSQMLQNIQVSRITELKSIDERYTFDKTYEIYTKDLQKGDDVSREKYDKLLRAKIKLWKKTAADIAAPLVEFYQSNR